MNPGFHGDTKTPFVSSPVGTVGDMVNLQDDLGKCRADKLWQRYDDT